MENQFIPTTPEEVRRRGWKNLDVILISGDSYIDSPLIGSAVIARVLEKDGYKVGIIAQPDIHSPADITRLGETQLVLGCDRRECGFHGSQLQCQPPQAALG